MDLDISIKSKYKEYVDIKFDKKNKKKINLKKLSYKIRVLYNFKL